MADEGNVNTSSALDAYRETCRLFLCGANPWLYGSSTSGGGKHAALEETVESLVMRRTALDSRGQWTLEDDPVRYEAHDPRNVWALQGRMMRPQVMVELPHLPSRPSTITIDQSWQGIKKEESSVEGHTTGSCLWDAAVVLADLLTIEPSVLLSLNGSYRELSGAAHQPIMRLPVPLLPVAVSSTILRSCRLLRGRAALQRPRSFGVGGGRTSARSSLVQGLVYHRPHCWRSAPSAWFAPTATRQCLAWCVATSHGVHSYFDVGTECTVPALPRPCGRDAVLLLISP